MSKAKQSTAPKADPKVTPKVDAPVYPSISTLSLGDHMPAATDLRPYTPELGDTFDHHVSAALVATFARQGTPLPFVPSPEHLVAIGGHEGIGKYGVRELGMKMGEQPTEYDLTADSIPLDVKVYNVDSTGAEKIKLACVAFASGHVVRVNDAFLVAYGTTEDGLVLTLTLSDGQTMTELDGQEVHVWSVSRP